VRRAARRRRCKEKRRLKRAHAELWDLMVEEVRNELNQEIVNYVSGTGPAPTPITFTKEGIETLWSKWAR